MARPRIYDDRTRDRLLELASASVAAGGEQGVSLRRLADEAGTTTAAVYALFGGRRQLLEAVVEEGFRRFGAALGAVAQTGDPRADLLALGIAYRDYALAEPDFYRVMFGGRRETEPAAGMPTFEVLHRAVARAVGSGPESEEEHDVTVSEALRLWGLAHGLVSLELAGLLDGDEQACASRYVEALRASRR